MFILVNPKLDKIWNNTLTIKIMNKVIKVTAFIMLVSTVVVLSINLVNCHTANKHLRKVVSIQANQLAERDSILYNVLVEKH